MAFQFKIQIEGIENPPVWRTVVVPESFTFRTPDMAKITLSQF